MVKTLVLGLGNPILSDDAAGLRVAEALRERINGESVTISEAMTGSLDLLELLQGYDRAIIIDSIMTPKGRPGTVYRFDISSCQGTRHTVSIHSLDFITALKLGDRLGLRLPGEILIFAIETSNVNTFSERCTPAVEQAIPVCVEAIVCNIASTSWK